MKLLLKFIAFIFPILVLSACSGSGSSPLLSLLPNNRIMIILKGTYASDRPLSMAEINNNQLFLDSDALDITDLPAYDRLPIFIDIGEIRLSSRDFMQSLDIIRNNEDSENFWDVISTERQVYCSQPYASDFDNDSCFKTGGIINYIEFMNGRGAVYPSLDVGSATYLHAGVFVRALATGHVRAAGAPLTGKFDNNDIFNAWNIMSWVNYEPESTDVTQQIMQPRWFPLHHKVVWGQQINMHVDNSFIPMVLEIRFNIKENLMVHSFTNAESQLQTVVGFSDWRRGHNGEENMGGNVLTRARMFHPDFTTHLRITNADPDTGQAGQAGVRYYYSIYILNLCADSNGTLASDCDPEEQLPLAATPVRGGNDNYIQNLPAGHYRLQCRYDCARDGYPERIISDTDFILPIGDGQSVRELSFQCGQAPPADWNCTP